MKRERESRGQRDKNRSLARAPALRTILLSIPWKRGHSTTTSFVSRNQALASVFTRLPYRRTRAVASRALPEQVVGPIPPCRGGGAGASGGGVHLLDNARQGFHGLGGVRALLRLGVPARPQQALQLLRPPLTQRRPNSVPEHLQHAQPRGLGT